jgi:hypothetical protein
LLITISVLNIEENEGEREEEADESNVEEFKASRVGMVCSVLWSRTKQLF